MASLCTQTVSHYIPYLSTASPSHKGPVDCVPSSMLPRIAFTTSAVLISVSHLIPIARPAFFLFQDLEAALLRRGGQRLRRHRLQKQSQRVLGWRQKASPWTRSVGHSVPSFAILVQFDNDDGHHCQISPARDGEDQGKRHLLRHREICINGRQGSRDRHLSRLPGRRQACGNGRPWQPVLREGHGRDVWTSSLGRLSQQERLLVQCHPSRVAHMVAFHKRHASE